MGSTCNLICMACNYTTYLRRAWNFVFGNAYCRQGGAGCSRLNEILNSIDASTYLALLVVGHRPKSTGQNSSSPTGSETHMGYLRWCLPKRPVMTILMW